jgi:Bacterial regulatory proteins, tetR family
LLFISTNDLFKIYALTRPYRLGKRQTSVDRTASSILAAARELVAESPAPSVGAIARRAGVSRLTVYSRFGSRAALLEAISPAPPDDGSVDLRLHFERSCAGWAENAALYRNLGAPPDNDAPRRIAEHLAATDGLRPGCSIKEAEDVIATLSSFAVFDRLHKDGRRSTAAVTEILLRLAATTLA